MVRSLLCVPVLVGLLFHPVPSRAEPDNHTDPPPNWLADTISTDRTLAFASPGPSYVVFGDVTVLPSATLTLEPGVTLSFMDSDFMASGRYWTRCELIVHGSLIAIGSQALPIGLGQGDPWGEVTIALGASCTFAHVILQNATVGVRIEGTASITNSTFIDCTNTLVSSGTLSVAGSTLSNTATGLEVLGGSALIQGCSISGRPNSAGDGIALYGGTLTTASADSLAAEPSTISGFSRGVFAAAPVELRNLIIVSSSYRGIQVAGVNVFVNYCTIVANVLGVFAESNTTRIYNSIIAANGTAVEFHNCNESVAYADIWQGWTPSACGVFGPSIANFDPGFAGTGPFPYRLSPASFFTDFSVSGGEIGAYGPSPHPDPSPDPPTNWLAGTISINRTLTADSPGPTYVVYGDITVLPGVTLTVEPGVTLSFLDSDFLASGRYWTKPEIVVQGSLSAIGAQTLPIMFGDAAATWGEVTIVPGAFCALSRVVLLNAIVGIRVEGSTSITNTTLANCQSYAVINSGTFDAAGSILADANVGLRSTSGSVSLVTTNLQLVETGFEMLGGSAALEGCRISARPGSGGDGIVLHAGDLTTASADSQAAVPSTISGFRRGVLAAAPSELRNLVVSDCSYRGIQVASSNVLINYCTIANNALGVFAEYADTRIYNSIIAANATAIEFRNCGESVAYTDIWQGWNTTPCGVFGPHVASFDPGFVGTGPTPYRLVPTSFFTDFSVSGGEIGAFGLSPGPDASPIAVEVGASSPRPLIVSPNPSLDGRFVITFSVPERGDVLLEAFDLVGRRVWSKDLPGLLTGDHQAVVGAKLSKGVYWLRLRGNGREFSRRFVVVG